MCVNVHVHVRVRVHARAHVCEHVRVRIFPCETSNLGSLQIFATLSQSECLKIAIICEIQGGLNQHA